MSGFTSKFRHVFGDAAKGKDQYSDIRNSMTSGESSYVKANARFLAYGKTAGGAPVFVRLLSAVGREAQKYVATHKGKLTDFDFHPFIDNIIATAADDCKVNINKYPREGLTENITKSEIELKGHRKKVSLISFNPAANNIIASAGYDRCVKIFNVENGSAVSTYDQFSDNIYSLAWNRNGSQLACTGKDKCLRLFDPRKPDDATVITDAFGGMKSTKCFWVNNFGWVGSTGFSKSAKREIKMWDTRNTEKPLYSVGLDNAASVLLPKFDDDLNMLYLAGKGDNSVTYYEVRNDDKMMYYLSLYRDSTPQKGGGWIFKRGCNVMKCEVARYLKLTKDTIIPISFVVPRKSGGDVFQEDIFPPCIAGRPGNSADEWTAGGNSDPPTMSMDPEERKDGDDYGAGDIQFTKKATYDEVVKENTELKSKVKALEEEIAALKAAAGGGAAEPAPAEDAPAEDPPADYDAPSADATL